MAIGRRKPTSPVEPTDSDRPTLHSPPPDFDLDEPTIRDQPLHFDATEQTLDAEAADLADDEPATVREPEPELHRRGDTERAPPPEEPDGE